ncbi:MAG: disulfide bond formation protein B [Thermohalobaculum sp.]
MSEATGHAAPGLDRVRAACLAAAAFGAAALAGALIAERVFHLVPCALCLLQRWPYRVAIGLGLAGFLLPPRAGRLALLAIFATLLAEAGAAGTHVGVERHWWPSPLPECTAPNFAGLSIQERLARMADRPSMSCEDPVYLVGPITFPQANLAYALAGAAAAAIFLARSARRPA